MTLRTYGLATIAIALAAGGCGGGSSSGDASSAPDPNKAEVSPPGDIPDNQAFVRYSPPGGGYSVEVPEGWARTTSGKTVTFTDKLNSVQMQSAGAGSAPTVSSLTTAVKAGESGAAGFKLVRVAPVKRSAGTGVRADYLIKGRADPVTGKSRTLAVERYVFFHKGRAVTLTLSGAKGADNVDPWRRVTDSLRWSA